MKGVFNPAMKPSNGALLYITLLKTKHKLDKAIDNTNTLDEFMLSIGDASKRLKTDNRSYTRLKSTKAGATLLADYISSNQYSRQFIQESLTIMKVRRENRLMDTIIYGNSSFTKSRRFTFLMLKKLNGDNIELYSDGMIHFCWRYINNNSLSCEDIKLAIDVKGKNGTNPLSALKLVKRQKQERKNYKR